MNCKSVAVVAFAAIVLYGCGNATAPTTPFKDVDSHRAGNLVVVLQSATGEITQGENQFAIEFRSAANNRPIDAGMVTASSSMAMPGMTPMTANFELSPSGQVGRYLVKGTFGMSGSWRYEVRWDGPAGRGSTIFNSSVR